MRRYALVLLVLGLGMPVRADLTAGETIYARVDQQEAQVDAALDVTAEARTVTSYLLPVFAAADTKPRTVFARANLRATLASIEIDHVEIASAPAWSPHPPAGIKIVWLRLFTGADLATKLPGPTEGAITLRVSYRQPHLGGVLYFLPPSPPRTVPVPTQRRWQALLIVRNPMKIIAPPAEGVDFERIADLLVIYLEPGRIVSIPLDHHP